MCGIFVSNKQLKSDFDVGELLCRRGPDNTNRLDLNSYTFIHTLLSMTGIETVQPKISNDIVCLFNGEIYNYNQIKNYDSDVYYILDSFNQHKDDFYRYLDGEFAIVLMDFTNNKLYLSTDTFGTKPLYYSIDSINFGISSYLEPLKNLGYTNIKKCNPNETLVFDIKTRELIDKITNYKFDLEQKNTHFDDWSEAFIESIKKRFDQKEQDIILPLSSGHDSGAIACAMEMLNIKFTSFSFFHNEHYQIIEERLKTRTGEYITKNKLSKLDRIMARQHIRKHCTSISYGPNLDFNNHSQFGIDDSGAQGLTFLLKKVKKKNQKIKILASGQGGDEIMGNLQSYKFKNPNPSLFPDNLSDVFPWENFYFGAQSSYLSREESISGSLGIEGRYPLLDKKVVQEFLWLDNKLKNKDYKAPISNFLNENNYPFIKGDPVEIKRGFNV